MGLADFVQNGVNTSKKIYEAGKETMLLDGLSFTQFFLKALKDTSIGAYNVFIKAEIDGLMKRNEVERVVNDNSEKVAYLIGGYYLSPSSLLNIKKELEKQGISTKIINKRYYSKKSLSLLVRELKTKMKEGKDKDIVIFGYSAGGIIAHKVGEKSGYKSVSFGISEEPSKTMVGTLLSLTKKDEIKDIDIPESGISLVESFSAMVSNILNGQDNTIRLDKVYSHMTIGRQDVVEKIVKQILLGFKNERI